jgi:hypothetical protein
VTDPVLDTAKPVTDPVLETAKPVTGPVLDAAKPVTDPVLGTAKPVLDTARPVTDPLLEAAEPVTGPAHEAVGPSVSPLEERAEPPSAAAPVERPEGLLAAPRAAAQGRPDGSALDSSPAVGPVLEGGPLQEASALRSGGGAFSPRPADAAPIASSAAPMSSTRSPYDTFTRASEGTFSSMGNSSSPPAAAARASGALAGAPAGDLEGSYSSRALSLGGLPSILDFVAAATAAAREASSQLPQSSPLSGAPPAPAPGSAPGSAPGGSSAGSGGAGPDLSGALALLLGAALAGKFLRYARDSLRPDSVYGLIVNQPS